VVSEDEIEQLPTDARQLFISSNTATLDTDAVRFSDPVYTVTPEDGSYAEFYPTEGGIYTIVSASSYEEDSEEESEDVDDVSENSSNVNEDSSEVKYAYSRLTSQGRMYWLIDTQNQTVEYCGEDSGLYRIGDFTGSLSSGMEVSYRDNGETVAIKLQFPNLYTFAQIEVDGEKLQMEKTDVASVEEILSRVRP
jgi:hypothetical protein